MNNKFILPKIDIVESGITSFLSEETMQYHYGKHHRGYVDKLNKYLEDSILKNRSLEEIVINSSGHLSDNAGQAWNHTFFWNCLSVDEKSLSPDSALCDALTTRFESMEKFNQSFVDSATSLFGSGWTWLVRSESSRLEIINTPNGYNPLRDRKIPLLTCDVWEHAYYLDYRNVRKDYVNLFMHHVNWPLVERIFNSGDVSFVGKSMLGESRSEVA